MSNYIISTGVKYKDRVIKTLIICKKERLQNLYSLKGQDILTFPNSSRNLLSLPKR